MIVLLLVLIAIVIFLIFIAIYTKQYYNIMYENFETSFLGNISSMFPKRSKALKGYLPTEKYLIQDIQAVDNDVVVYENN